MRPLGQEGRFSSPPHSAHSSCFLQLYSNCKISLFLKKIGSYIYLIYQEEAISLLFNILFPPF